MLFLNSSIVLTANQHNPTIIHPLFLKQKGIVPEDWETSENPICTPPISITKFNNGIVFVVEPEKLQITDNNFDKAGEGSPIPEIMNKYVDVLQHIPYQAVGHNFTGFIESSDRIAVMKSTFIRESAITKLGDDIGGVSLQFTIPQSDHIFQLSITSSTIERISEPEKKEGITIKANFHFNLDEANPLESISSVSGRFKELHKRFLAQVEELFPKKVMG